MADHLLEYIVSVIKGEKKSHFSGGGHRKALPKQIKSYVECQVTEEMKEGAVLSDRSLCILVGGSFRVLSSSLPLLGGQPGGSSRKKSLTTTALQ